MRRLPGIAAAAATHALFAVTVWHLFWFLKGDTPQPSGGTGSLLGDAGLALGFGAIHSALLHPRVREPLTTWIAPPFYGLFFCVVTSVTLLALIFGWKTGSTIWWTAPEPVHTLITTLWYGSWVLLFGSLWLAGLGYQTGITPWWSWFRRQPLPRRKFEPRGLFLWIRHPAYLGFLGLVYCVPVLTADRVLLMAAWTVYVAIGSWLKDRRLLYYVGEPYRVYQSQVPGYPGMPWGPLARQPLTVGPDGPPHPETVAGPAASVTGHAAVRTALPVDASDDVAATRVA